MNTETDAIRERMTDEELESAFPNIRKEVLTKEFTKGSHTIILNVQDYSAIQNIVRSVEGSTTFRGDEIDFVYISNMRVCIQFKDRREFSFPMGDRL